MQVKSGSTNVPSDGGGCTIGTTANYDLALLLFAFMGVVLVGRIRRKA